ncbi:FliM/FliN family flagellar motor switch protein, partial [Succinimonas sp.]
LPDHTLVFVEDLPTYHAKLGRTDEKLAIKITEQIKRPEFMKNELALVLRRHRGAADEESEEQQETEA